MTAPTSKQDIHEHKQGFHWWRLDLTNAVADLHFLGQTLALTGLSTDLHGGSAAAELYFDWAAREPGTLVRGQVQATNLVLTGLMHALVSPSNRLEGVVHGTGSWRLGAGSRTQRRLLD